VNLILDLIFLDVHVFLIRRVLTQQRTVGESRVKRDTILVLYTTENMLKKTPHYIFLYLEHLFKHTKNIFLTYFRKREIVKKIIFQTLTNPAFSYWSGKTG